MRGKVQRKYNTDRQ